MAADTAQRWGITIPFEGIPLHAHREWIDAIAAAGYTDVWSAEVDDADGFTPLVLSSQWQPSLRLGVAVIPVYTRGPATLASQAASLADAAPGRFVLGVGSSSDVIVERWNGLSFDRPYQRVRDTVRFLRTAMTGEKVKHDYETFSVKGFRLKRVPEEPPVVLVAALREGMLRLAGREADGAILNWLSADDVATVVPHVHGQGDGKEIAARIFVCPTDDASVARSVGRFGIAAYLNVPVYRAFHEWLGRGPALQGMWDAWAAGDRQAAMAAVPDEVVDELVVWGTPEQCRDHVQRYVDQGVHTPAMLVLPGASDLRDAVTRLGPAA